MRLGLSSWSLPWAVREHRIDRLGLLRRAITLGADAVQYADNLPLTEASPDELQLITATAAEHGIGIEIGCRGIGPSLGDELALAVAFGAGFVRLVVDQGDDRPTPDEVVARLRPWEQVFRQAGVRLAIENHDRFRSDLLAMIISELGDWTAVCLDTVNSLGAVDPPERVLGLLAPLTVNLHVKDFRVERADHGLGFVVVGTAVGEGMLDVPAVLAAVAGYGRTETAVIELWTSPGLDLDATLAEESGRLDRSVVELRHQLDALPTV